MINLDDLSLSYVPATENDAAQLLSEAREARRQLSAMVAGRMLASFDRKGRLTDANEMFLRTFVYSREQATRLNLEELCHQNKDAGTLCDGLLKDVLSGQSRSFAFTGSTSEGVPLCINSMVSPLYDAAGKTQGFLLCAVDVTETSLQSVEALSKVEAIGRSQGVIEFDLNGNILNANAHFLGLMGYSLDEVQGQHHSMFVAKSEVQTPGYRNFWKKLASGSHESGEYLRLAKDGHPVWLRATYNPVLDIAGKPIKIVKFCMDITAQKLASLESEGRWSALSTASCIAELDREARILSMNENMLHALGYSEQDVIGKHDSFLVFDEDVHSEAHETMWLRLRDGETLRGQYRRKGLGGRETWFDASISPIMGLDDKLLKIVIVGHDITADRTLRVDLEGKLKAIDRSQVVIEFDPQGYVLAANANFLALMGYSLAEIRTHHHRMFVTPQHATSVEYEAFWEKLGRGEYVSGEFLRIGKAGREVWIQATYNPVFDLQGKLVKIVKFAQDVTQMKVRAAEFQSQVQAIDRAQAVIEFSVDGHVQRANRNFLAVMGYTQREVEGQHHSMFCSLEYSQSPEYRDFWLRLSEGGLVSGRFHRIGKYNRDVWIQASYNPIYDLNGRIIKVVKYAYDVTKEVELEQLINTNTRAMSASVAELLASITSIAAHSSSASEKAARSLEMAREGRVSIGKSLDSILRIEQSTSRVTEIVTVIGDIASQTNLLAFNAALEAARAGQHGVGFSVVASEVRKLAERCATAAKEIRELIGESVQNVSQGAEVGQSAAGNFESVLEHVAATARSVEEIAGATDEQRNLAQQVTQMIETLAHSPSVSAE